jgi:hypothetical protein
MTKIIYREQQYELLRLQPYKRKDGEMTIIAIWVSRCPECDAEFQTRTSIGRPPRIRRCEAHRAPGIRVPWRPPSSARHERAAR